MLLLILLPSVYLQPEPLIWLLQKLCGSAVLWHLPSSDSIALTIDDAPHGDGTSTTAILDCLRRHGCHATFFVISGQARGRESILRRALLEGHELANHMTEDTPSIMLTDFETHLMQCDHFLRQLSPGTPPRWFRPGSGFFSSRMLETVSRWVSLSGPRWCH